MEEQFWALLTGSAAVTALVPATRIVWGVMPQGSALPGIVMHVIGNQDQPHLSDTDGLWRGRVQVDCYGLTYASAKLTARAVIGALNGHADTNFRGVFLDAHRDDHETGATDRPFRVSLDFITHWRA